MAKKRRVKGYLGGEQTREKLTFETYQYHLPFNYRNIMVFRKYYSGGEFHGMELEPYTAASDRINVRQCKANEWFQARAVFRVPPRTVTARFEIEVAQQRPGETLLIDDVAGVAVPDDFRRIDPAPRGAKNQLKNPGFELADAKTGFARNWEMVNEGKGELRVTDEGAHKGKRAIMVNGVAGIAMWQDVKVKEGQTLLWTAWLKSSKPDPRAVLIFPKFFDRWGLEISDHAADCIAVSEERPIVRVVVIGSACTPPGYVQVECEELESWRRGDEVRTVMPVRFRMNNLWGMHLRADQWLTLSKDVKRGLHPYGYEAMPKGILDVYPGLKDYAVKCDASEFPLTGMSSAIFEVPPSRRVLISGGSEIPGWSSDGAADDAHYSFRIIRTTVMK